MIKKTITISLIIAFVLTGCANINVTVQQAGKSEAGEASEKSPAYVDGPYGSLSISVPDNWQYKVCDLESRDLIGERYGFTFNPKHAKDGWIELFVTDSFGVCGTDLTEKETTIGGMPAAVGVYGDRKHWDFVVIGEEAPQVVATNTGCDSWDESLWQEAWEIIESLEYDPTVTKGCIWQFIPESEDTDIAVSMEMANITPTGATIRISNYDWAESGEISYGEEFSIEKENNGKWEDVPRIVDNAAFTEVAYIVPLNETVEIKTNWEWLYGTLTPGTYRIKKTILDTRDGKSVGHDLIAQFLVAGQ